MSTGNTTTNHDSHAPTSPATSTTTDNISFYAYDMAFILGFAALVIFIVLASYMCIRANHRPTLPSRPLDQVPAPQLVSGINEATLLSYPKILYSNAKGGEQGGSTCPICLGDYKDRDVLRLLPDCGHFFHVKCVDPWLRSSPTCPLCRKCQTVEIVQNSVVLGN